MKKTRKIISAGVVVSDKLPKTIIVRVDSLKMHKLYEKKYLTNKKYHVHDEKNKYKVGDKVKFYQCKPISRNKKWTVNE